MKNEDIKQVISDLEGLSATFSSIASGLRATPYKRLQRIVTGEDPDEDAARFTAPEGVPLAADQKPPFNTMARCARDILSAPYPQTDAAQYILRDLKKQLDKTVTYYAERPFVIAGGFGMWAAVEKNPLEDKVANCAEKVSGIIAKMTV